MLNISTEHFEARLIDVVGKNDRAQVVFELEKHANQLGERYPQKFIMALCSGLRDSDWHAAGSMFAAGEFFGPHGDFILIAPFLSRRGGKTTGELSAIVGRVDLEIYKTPPAERDEQNQDLMACV